MDLVGIAIASLIILVTILLYNFIQHRRMLDISGKSVLVTGCDSGFGRGVVRRLDKLGCQVFAGCLTEEAVTELQNESSSRVVPVQIDVTSDDSIALAMDVVKQHTKDTGLWGLINNAGLYRGSMKLEFLNRKLFEDIMAVNMIGAAMVTKECLPLIKKAKGRIVNTSSVAGFLSSIKLLAYSSSKFAMEGFSDGLRKEVLPAGVRVSIVEPAHFKTGLFLTEEQCKANISLYEAASDEVRALYPDLKKQIYDKSILDNQQATFHATDISPVLDAYIHGLFAVHPKRRYLPGKQAKILGLLYTILPCAVTDFILSKDNSHRFADDKKQD